MQVHADIDRAVSGVQRPQAQVVLGEQKMTKRKLVSASQEECIQSVDAVTNAGCNPVLASRIGELVSAVRAAVAMPGGHALKTMSDLRRELSIHTNPPIQEAIDQGALTPIVAYLGSAASAAVQLEAAWAITNIASGASTHVAALVDAGAAEAIYRVLASKEVGERSDLCDQCLWALGNIAGDADVRMRDQLIQSGVIGHLAQFFEHLPSFPWSIPERMQVLQTLSWLMSSLCRGKPAPPLEEVDCAFDFFAQVIGCTDDAKMLSEALWGQCYLLEGAVDDQDLCQRAARILSAGFAPGEVPCAPTPHPVLLKVVGCTRRAGDPLNPLPIPAVRLLSTVVSSTAEHVTDAVIAAGASKAFCDLLCDGLAPVEVRRIAAWALSNIAAGSASHAQKLIDTSGVWGALCDGVRKGSAHSIKSECTWAIANLAKRGPTTLGRVDSKKILEMVTIALKVESDPDLHRALLDAAEVVLCYGDGQVATKGHKEHPFLAHAEACGFVDELESLQHAEQAVIYLKARRILEGWFTESENCENEPPRAKGHKDKSAQKAFSASVIMQSSPTRPQAYKFGA